MKKLFYFIFYIVFTAFTFSAVAQTTVVQGTVTDSETKKPAAYVNIYFTGSSGGVVTDLEGKYLIQTDQAYTELEFSYLGYKTTIKKIIPGSNVSINVVLYPEVKVLDEVVVKLGKKKEKYRNKNNPAVDLIRKVIENKDKNRAQNNAFMEYEEYEKLQMSLSNVASKYKEKKLFKKYKWLFENVDTTRIPGQALLPVYLQETLSDIYFRKDPEKKLVRKKANQKVSFDEYIDNQGLSTYLNYLYADVDIYDNNVTVLSNQFLSPIADVSPTFYKFYITDTLRDQEPKLIEVAFSGRNPQDFLFQGRMYVTLDSQYAVKALDMTVNSNINLNWIRNMRLQQNYEIKEDQHYYLSKSVMFADFGLSKNRGGMYGERSISIKNYTFNKTRTDDFFESKNPAEKSIANEDPAFWNAHRHDSLSEAESKVYQNIDSLQKMPSFKRTMNILTLLLAGYKGFGWWELGPVNTFYSFNPVEGFRLRAGGRTTPKLNNKFYFETYAAYGFKDEKWKYFFGGTYSFTGNAYQQFPARTLKASFQKDTKIPGQELQFIQEDNFLLSFKRGVNNKWLYNDIFRIDYLHEFENHFSYSLGFKNWTQTPAGGLKYERKVEDNIFDVQNITTTEFSLELRIAPKEQFYQGKLYRTPIPNKFPIISARFITGVKGLFNGEYSYQNILLNVYKRAYLSQLGYTDLVFDAGYIFGNVPFPLLAIHRANQTYSLQLQSYNLMNFLEFVSDHFVSMNFDHNFNGFIFNKIPLLKKIKLREVASLKILYGGIRKENNPAANPNSYVFPTNNEGITTTYSLRKEPYIEASVGIANIFKIIRVDLVKRLSYYDHPNISTWGIRARFKLDF